MDEHLKGAAQVFGVCEGLELPQARRVPSRGALSVRDPAFDHADEKRLLSLPPGGDQACTFSGFLEGCEEDVGGQILLAGVCQGIRDQPVFAVAPEGTGSAMWLEAVFRT